MSKSKCIGSGFIIKDQNGKVKKAVAKIKCSEDDQIKIDFT